MTVRRRERHEKKGRKWVIALLLALALVAGGLYGGYQLGWLGETHHLVTGDIFPEVGEGAVSGHLPDMTEEQIKQQMQQVADASQFSFKINAEPVFENGDGAGTLRIENPSHNVYPFVVEIFLKDTGEKVYDSGGILPDYHIDKAKLNTALEKGAHAAVAHISAYSPDTGEYQGKSIVNLSIIVKN